VWWRPWDPAQAFGLEVMGAFDQVYNLITTELVDDNIGSGALYSYVNVNQARMGSLTTSVSLLHNLPLHLDVTYIFLHAWDVSNDRRLQGRANHQGTASLAWRHAPTQLSMGVRGNVLSNRPFYAGDEVDLRPATAMADLWIGWQALPQLTLRAGVDNLFDGGVPDITRPRRVYLGLTGRFQAKQPGVSP